MLPQLVQIPHLTANVFNTSSYRFWNRTTWALALTRWGRSYWGQFSILTSRTVFLLTYPALSPFRIRICFCPNSDRSIVILEISSNMKYARLDSEAMATNTQRNSNTNNSVEINGLNSSYRNNLIRGNIGDNDLAARAPPLKVSIGDEVTVINGDRSNLTWKRYKLISIIERSGLCIVGNLNDDSKQRTFPRSMVKPKVR